MRLVMKIRSPKQQLAGEVYGTIKVAPYLLATCVMGLAASLFGGIRHFFESHLPSYPARCLRFFTFFEGEPVVSGGGKPSEVTRQKAKLQPPCGFLGYLRLDAGGCR